jgi:hypothetical protein
MLTLITNFIDAYCQKKILIIANVLIGILCYNFKGKEKI